MFVHLYGFGQEDSFVGMIAHIVNLVKVTREDLLIWKFGLQDTRKIVPFEVEQKVLGVFRDEGGWDLPR